MIVHKVLGFILMLAVLSCSDKEEPIKSKPDISEMEKNLRDSIEQTKIKYSELDGYQKSIRDDIQNQLVSIGCSAHRLIRLKQLEKSKIKTILPALIDRTKFLYATRTENWTLIKTKQNYEYKYKINLSIGITKDVTAVIFDDYKIYTQENDQITYQNTLDKSQGEYTGELQALIPVPAKKIETGEEEPQKSQYKNRQCLDLYKRSIPNSQQAKDDEAKAFEQEIAYAIKRIDSFQERFETLETLASGFTVYESGFNRLLQEYQTDKNSMVIDQSYTNFLTKVDETINGLKQKAQVQFTPAEIEAVHDIFTSSDE